MPSNYEHSATPSPSPATHRPLLVMCHPAAVNFRPSTVTLRLAPFRSVINKLYWVNYDARDHDIIFDISDVRYLCIQSQCIVASLSLSYDCKTPSNPFIVP